MSIGNESVGKASGEQPASDDTSRPQNQQTGTTGRPGEGSDKSKPYDPDRSRDPGKTDLTDDPIDDADDDDDSLQGDGTTVTQGDKPRP